MTKMLIFLFIIGFINASTFRMMTGGWSPVSDNNSENIQGIAEFATANISHRSNSVFILRTMEVISAEEQVVSGINYRISMKIGSTECKKNAQSSDVDLNKCAFLCEAPQMCNATVWVQSWLNLTKLTKYNCERGLKPEDC